jgi:poly-beta-1,6-N-acetyl-D-glucosamine biosynthesis protein PgaD
MTKGTEFSKLTDSGNRALIFESHWSGARSQKVTTGGVAAFFWGLWLSLWAPLATYAFWALAPLWGPTP